MVNLSVLWTGPVINFVVRSLYLIVTSTIKIVYDAVSIRARIIFWGVWNTLTVVDSTAFVFTFLTSILTSIRSFAKLGRVKLRELESITACRERSDKSSWDKLRVAVVSFAAYGEVGHTFVLLTTVAVVPDCSNLLVMDSAVRAGPVTVWAGSYWAALAFWSWEGWFRTIFAKRVSELWAEWWVTLA